MSANTRIYSVHGKGIAPHLVRASSSAQAVRHVTRNMFEVDVATQEKIVELMGLGCKVETAGEEPAAPGTGGTSQQ